MSEQWVTLVPRPKTDGHGKPGGNNKESYWKQLEIFQKSDNCGFKSSGKTDRNIVGRVLAMPQVVLVTNA